MLRFREFIAHLGKSARPWVGEGLVGGFLRQQSGAWKRLFAALAIVSIGIGGACSSSINTPEFKNRKPTHPVTGKMQVAGKPAAGAFVLLVPKNEPEGSPDPRPRATVQPDGSFTLSTYGENDGAPVGEYTVAVSWEDPESKSDRFNGRYNAANSRMSASVKEGTNDLPPIELK
jgi:hypothetical protein